MALSKENASLINHYKTWSISYLPYSTISKVSRQCAKVNEVNQNLLRQLIEVWHVDMSWRAQDELFRDDMNDSRKFVFVIRKLQKKRLCKGSWCPLYYYHGIVRSTQNGPQCLSIGALQVFLLERGVKNASQHIDEYFQRHSWISRYTYPTLFVRSFLDEIKDCNWRRNNERGIQLLMDFNTLTEDQIRMLFGHAQSTGEITPFVIPKWEEYFIDQNIPEMIEYWKKFVSKQIEELSIYSVVVLNLCCGRDAATNPETADENMNVGNGRIDNRNDAIKFIRRVIREKGRLVVDVSLDQRPYEDANVVENDENFVDNDDENDENDEHTELEHMFNLCTHEINPDKLKEALLMCPYWAAENMPTSAHDV